MPDKPEASILQREVSATVDEFRRGFMLAFPGRVEERGNVLRATRDDAALEITLTVGEPRRIANLRLPTLYVVIRFTAGDETAQQSMLEYMDQAMHRGGG